MPTSPSDPPATARPKRVLLVDDNVDALESFVMLLEMHGLDVRGVSEPFEALALALAFDPDVAILDIGLPGIDGYELARRLRAQAGGARCRLVALTGRDDRARSLAAGFDAHLVKPVEPERLLAALG